MARKIINNYLMTERNRFFVAMLVVIKNLKLYFLKKGKNNNYLLLKFLNDKITHRLYYQSFAVIIEKYIKTPRYNCLIKVPLWLWLL